MTDNTTNAFEGRREKWWSVVKAVAFELKPFSLPTREGLRSAVESVRTNAGQIAAELKRVAPEAVGVMKTFKAVKILGLSVWLCGWALFIWLEFGAVYFIISSMTMIFMNLGDRQEGEWSAYSVFNAGCRALLGTINAEQFEREIMRQNVAAPPGRHDDDDDVDGHRRHQHANNNPDDDFVWVEPEHGMRDADNDDDNDAAIAAAVAADADAAELLEAGSDHDSDYDDDDDEAADGAGAGGDAAARGAGARGGGRKVSGKRARRGFEGRRERQEERRLALQALGQDEWQ